MNRAFVKEPDGGVPEEGLPERQISEHPNYVTPSGLRQLQQKVGELEQRRLDLRERAVDDTLAREELDFVDRDLRYFTLRLETAQPVDLARQPRRMVKFGAAVSVKEGGGAKRVFRIVGEDEADPNNGLISYVSPLAEALLDARFAATVRWHRPAGDRQLTIEAIDYPEE
jgi:transcription elongation GreA/GreB family factor